MDSSWLECARRLVLLDPATGELQRPLAGDGDVGYYVNFSDDGSRVATVTREREAVVWEVSSGPGAGAHAPQGGRRSGGLQPARRRSYTAGSSHTLRHWDLDGERRYIGQVATVPAGRIPNIEAVQPAPGGGCSRSPPRVG